MAHDQSTRRNLIIGTGEGILAMPWAFLSLPGNFILAALLTQFYGLDKTSYGIIVSLPAWSNAGQIVFLPWLARYLTTKDLALAMGWLNIGLWTMLAAVLGYLPTDDAPGVARLFIVFFVITSLSGSLVGVGWTSWVRVWVPARVRGEYFGRRNRWLNLSTVVFLLFALGLFAGQEHELWPYQLLIVLAVVLRYGGLIWQHGIRTQAEHLDVVGTGWWSHLQACLATPGLLRFILFSAWVSFWLGFVGPFVPVFSFEELGLQPGGFTILVIIATVAGIFAWPFWGRQVDRRGCLPVLMAGLAAWELQNYLWVILHPGNTWLLYPMWAFGGFFSTAYFAASFNLLLKLVPPEAKLAGVSLHLAVTSLAAAAAPIAAGLLLTHFLAAGAGITVYRAGFALKSTAVLSGLLMLRGMREPQRSNQTSLPGAFRTLRQLLAAQSAIFLDSWITRRAKNRRRED